MSSEGHVGRVVDQRTELGHLVDRGLVGDRESDDNVGRGPVRADEPVVLGLGPADRGVDPIVGDEAVERAGDRLLEGLGPRIVARLALEDRDDGAPAGPEVPRQPIGDGSGLRIRVGPAASAQRPGDLRRERCGRDGEQDGDDEDGTAEAVDERSPGTEHDGLPQSALLSVASNHREWSFPLSTFSRCGVRAAALPLRERPFVFGVDTRATPVRRPGTAGPRPDHPRRGRGVLGEGLSPRDDRRRRRQVRPVGRCDLHALHRQGGAVPPELRPDLRTGPRRAGDPPGAAHLDRRPPLHGDRLLRRDDRRVPGSAGPGGSRPRLGRGRRGARRPRDAGPPPRAVGGGRAVAAPPGHRGR